MTMNLRKSVFSGSWYPARERDCEEQILGFLEEGKTLSVSVDNPIGGIVPHAGWFFSGSIACNVIHRISLSLQPDVVVVFGMHLHPESANYMMPEGQWETPFGPINVNTNIADALIRRHDFQLETPARFNQDNTIELQMPFIRYFFKEAEVVAMGVPPTENTLKIARSVVDVSQERGNANRSDRLDGFDPLRPQLRVHHKGYR
jgi:AmmeMemoRadiSam system protein B